MATKKHETGFEPATLALARRYSTTEPLVHIRDVPLKTTHRLSDSLSGHLGNFVSSMWLLRFRSSFRPISSSQLHASLHFHPCPIYLIVSKGSLTFLLGDLILRGASRLDAFSVYPSPSWLPSRAIGMTTGPPADGPSRSSRTKDSSSQISCARAG